jgi:hypothetical protein
VFHNSIRVYLCSLRVHSCSDSCTYDACIITLVLEITIARKVLPHPQGIKGSMRNLMKKRLFSLHDPALPGRDVWRDDFDVLK